MQLAIDDQTVLLVPVQIPVTVEHFKEQQ